ncbi:MAG: L-serine ammonia-lyase [Variovorax paradoxus]|uniref:L-serine dehydratase n=1 Tax=Variovorax paradoxus TaxID=34073 RepID=A0A2W5SRS7_VARPD|nr:MAG: L-serine ammonia-lyase [Variovorax paradoxus]
MALSTFDLFKIGIGPSSSHTVGPMHAANLFIAALQAGGMLARVSRVSCAFYGSLGATGKGHGTDKAVMLGLEGETPDGVDPDGIAHRLARIREGRSLALGGVHPVAFVEAQDLQFHRRETLPFHPNGMQLIARDAQGHGILERTYYSIGGGFVVQPDEAGQPTLVADPIRLPHPFKTGSELLRECKSSGKTIAQVMWANELTWRRADEIESGLRKIWDAMQACVKRGVAAEGTLPGPLKVRRRAAELYRELTSIPEAALRDPLQVMDWVNLYALAVNEENAAGGRIVTAPTNGAAGIVPATLLYYRRFVPGSTDQGVFDFLLTAAAIAILYKENASISGAEVGCQGEVGVACSMSAAALCAVLGGTPEQVENAAEIGMEHHLGLTCDPVGGLVQIPCIERNAIGSVKAINAARLALRGDGKHHVSLDNVIKTMRETGADMKSKYRETSRGGLALNVVEC